MSKKIIEAKEPRCEYCLRGKLSADGETVLCTKKGVMNKDFSCKKFRYDPLKRVPDTRKPGMADFNFTPDDFAL